MPGARRSRPRLDTIAVEIAALAAFRNLWFPEGKHEASIYAIEFEQERATALRKKLSLPEGGSLYDVTLHCDAFHVEIKPEEGASLLFRNPPYDIAKVHGRLSGSRTEGRMGAGALERLGPATGRRTVAERREEPGRRRLSTVADTPSLLIEINL